MRTSIYVFSVAIFLLIFNYVTGARGPQFYYKIRELGMLCKKGDVIRDDESCSTCICMFNGVIRCLHSKCPEPPDGLVAAAHALPVHHGETNNVESIVKVHGCTPESEQTLEACVTCKCLNSEEMSCVKIQPCTASALASLDYLFGDRDYEDHKW